MKECFKCKKVYPLSEFYKHKQMADGHLNKCKKCAKTDSTLNRGNNLERIRAYDRARGARQSKGYLPEYRDKYPNKYKSHSLVNSAIKCKRLFRKPCEVCGSKERMHAHHDDYLEPLNVRWLCAKHHSQWHRDNGEALNP
jgi:hypothetical protein